MGVALIGGFGCSRPNPFFALLSEGTGEATSGTGEAMTSGAASTTSTSTGAEETGAGSTSPGSSETSTGGETTGGETGTSSEGTGTIGASSSSSGEESSSGGEMEEFVAYDLWELCPQAAWNAEGDKNVPNIKCNVEAGNPMPPWAGHLEGFMFEGMVVPRVLAMWPYQGAENVVTGRYKGLTMDDASSPRLRAVLVCPGPSTCEIRATVWAETADNKVKAFQGIDMLGTGQHVLFDLDLEAVNDGVPFDLVVQVESVSPAPSTRGLWLRPRILVFP